MIRRIERDKCVGKDVSESQSQRGSCLHAHHSWWPQIANTCLSQFFLKHPRFQNSSFYKYKFQKQLKKKKEEGGGRLFLLGLPCAGSNCLTINLIWNDLDLKIFKTFPSWLSSFNYMGLVLHYGPVVFNCFILKSFLSCRKFWQIFIV